eukprot:6067804-Amphidinium_carterae.1
MALQYLLHLSSDEHEVNAWPQVCLTPHLTRYHDQGLMWVHAHEDNLRVTVLPSPMVLCRSLGDYKT